MNRLTQRSFALLWLCLPGAAAGSELQGEIRFAPAAEGTVWVGQKVELNLELWSTGYSFGDQVFALPEVPGGYLFQADSTTVKLSNNSEGVQWQGLSYTLLFYPQRAGRLDVPSFEVQFSSGTGYGSQPTLFDFRTPVLQIDARLPPGASGDRLLVTTGSFSMQASWVPSLSEDGAIELMAGDSLTLQVEREAADVPGMVFTPLPHFNTEGISVYPEAPQVTDRVNRGSLTGSRIDSDIYIFEQAGNYTIPGLSFQWWDPEREVLSERVIPETAVTVSANPVFAGREAIAQTGKQRDWKAIAATLILLFTVVFLLSIGWLYLKRASADGTLSRVWRQIRVVFRKYVKKPRVLPPLNPGGVKEQ